ncbi:alpha/beta hydrolase fold domain-containing protein [Prosthecobacter sp.]|uniref:prolyl oligopeptidase family serine peptidase n=1 Tax=Prosthecobacter sp. TaxID=1965333 RepID=UPI001DBC2AD3|nr:alpha/beta hydrolase fold domain-containing protein [Prosthecobacter sp.]MCB1275118.1 prolyl oligopeptidase family serine peptidase [Prosthecobacter sp.]
MNCNFLIAATLAFASLVGFTHAADGTFSFTVLEIPDIQRGAGLAVVMRTPSGKTWLYDTGTAHPERLSSDGWLANFNAGRDVVAPLLKKQGVTVIDGVFISHAHYDHFGGLLWLKDHFDINKLIDCGYIFRSGNEDDYRGTNKSELDHYNLVRDEFKARGAHITATAGEMLNLDSDLKIEVIAPPKSYFKDPKVNTRQKNDTPSHFLVNANSLALRIQFGDIVFLLPGDIQTEDIEASLMPFVDKTKLKCHILVAPGHGIHPIPQAFREATHPEVSIASVFPRYAKGIKSTVTLKALGAKTYVTGLHGTVQVVTDGKTYQVTTERDDTNKPTITDRVPLWPGKAPVGDGKFEECSKELEVFLPPAGKANGAAIVLCPGGGYIRHVTEKEGYPIAQWLNEHGIACVILEYRLPSLRHQVPLLDAQRAIRLTRANAAAWKIDPQRIGILGFSAGGHVASTALTHFNAGDAANADPIERLSCRPDFGWLVYPVVTMGEFTHTGSKNELIGENSTAELLRLYSNELQVADNTPPVFLAHAIDDKAVPIENSRQFVAAMQKHQRPVELLELPSGGHGLNGCKGPLWEQWNAAALVWSAKQKIIPAP